MEKSDHSLRLYSKALLPIRGICKLKVTNPKTQTEYTVRFLIVKGDYVPLLGANAAQKMGLLTVNYASIFDENVDNISSTVLLQAAHLNEPNKVLFQKQSCQPSQRLHLVQKI